MQKTLRDKLVSLEAYRSTFRGLLTYHTRIYDLSHTCYHEERRCENPGEKDCPYIEGQKDYYTEALKTVIDLLDREIENCKRQFSEAQ